MILTFGDSKTHKNIDNCLPVVASPRFSYSRHQSDGSKFGRTIHDCTSSTSSVNCRDKEVKKTVYPHYYGGGSVPTIYPYLVCCDTSCNIQKLFPIDNGKLLNK